jgi:hypothetical protein
MLSGMAKHVLFYVETATEIHPNHFSLPCLLHFDGLYAVLGAIDLAPQLLQLRIGLLGLFGRQRGRCGKRD